MTLEYPCDLAGKLRKAWRREAWPGERIPRRPDMALIMELLEVAYHASMRSEEQRRVRFRIALLSPKQGEDLPSEVIHPYITVLRFSEEREFSVSELVRLSPATEERQTLICVWCRQVRSKTARGRLSIWGLVDFGLSWWELTHDAANWGWAPPKCFTVTSSEPGELKVSRAGHVVLTLRQGRTYEPSQDAFSDTALRACFTEAEAALYTEVCSALEVQQLDPDGLDDYCPAPFYQRFLRRVLFQVQQERHGGTILVVPHEVADSPAHLSGVIAPKYSCSHSGVWHFLVRALVAHERYYDLKPSFDRSATVSTSDSERHEKLRAELEDSERSIANWVRMVAAMSRVDGATLLTDRFQILGFGAEITADSASVQEIILAPSHGSGAATSAPVDSYGTRHRSTFRFCASVRGSVAFVVSQDGGLKGICQSGGAIAMWPDIEIRPFVA